MADNSDKNDIKVPSPGSKFGEYKGEFKRIIWPTKEELFKNTQNSIVICVMFGLVIFALDLVFNQAMTMLSQLIS